MNGLALRGNDLISMAKGTLELGCNALGVFELEFLVSLFWRMEHLQVIDLSGNFGPDKGNGKALCQMLQYLPHLTRIRIAGTPGSGTFLGPQAILFLDSLILTNRQLDELDISHNRIGDDGIDRVIRVLANCPRMETLYVDGSFPQKRSTFKHLADAVRRHGNLKYFVFPNYDATAYLKKSRSRDERHAFMRLMEECHAEIHRRQGRGARTTMLPFCAVPELEELVNSISGDGGTMQKVLEEMMIKNVIAVHGAITQDVKVTLPYLLPARNDQAEGEPIEAGGLVFTIEPEPESGVEEWHADCLHMRVNEDALEVKEIDWEADGPLRAGAMPRDPPAPQPAADHQSDETEGAGDEEANGQEEDESETGEDGRNERDGSEAEQAHGKEKHRHRSGRDGSEAESDGAADAPGKEKHRHRSQRDGSEAEEAHGKEKHRHRSQRDDGAEGQGKTGKHKRRSQREEGDDGGKGKHKHGKHHGDGDDGGKQKGHKHHK
jgi:hypothetical protein